MKKYIYIIYLFAANLIIGASFAGCSDNEDFPNKPNKIDIEQVITLTPINGGVKVDWTPDPADENFVFLHIVFNNQDGATCRYSLSRYNSNLVVPEWTDDEGNKTPNPNKTVSTTITNLVNQEYTLNFYGYNNENKSIELGSRKITPLDYKECEPDSIFAVNVTSEPHKIVKLEWKEPPHKSGSTTKGVRFVFTNIETGEVVSKDFELGIRHAEIQMEEEGEYNLTYGTFSEKGKVFTKTLADPIAVAEIMLTEYWTAADKTAWKITGCTEQIEYEDGHFRNMLDGNPNSYWHSMWYPEDSELPHHFIVDINKEMTIGACFFLQRNQGDRQVTEIAIYVSKENKDDAWGEAVFRGSLKTGVNENCVRQTINLAVPTNGRFIKVETLKGTGGVFHCMAEFGIKAGEIK